MRKLSATIVSLLVAAPLLAVPGGPGGPGKGGPGRGFGASEPGAHFEHRAERIAELLKLDDSQRAAFERMRTEGMASARPKLERMRALHQELRALLDGGSSDARAIGEKTLAVHQLRAELRAERQAAESAFVKLLDDEQRFAFEAFTEAREMRRDDRGRHFGRRSGPGEPDSELD